MKEEQNLSLTKSLCH